MISSAAAAVLAALALAATAGAAPSADPGVTPTTVLLGDTVPLTGEAAAFGSVGPAAKAYFDLVNAGGGVRGRKVEDRYYDDAYNPAQTVQLTRRLVEQDRVFAVFNPVGTANNLAVRDYLNAQNIASVSIEPTIMRIARFNAPELTRGALSIAFVKNPSDPIWRKDKAVALYRSIMSKHNPSGKPTDVYNWYGMTVAWTMVKTLRKAGRNLTRAGLLEAAQSLDTTANPFMLPGIRLKTSRTDYRPMEQVYLHRYDNKQW